MKFNKIKTLAIIAIFVFAVNAFTQISKASIVATGLTCSMCSNAINKQLYNLPEVDSILTDLNTNTFVVYLKKGNQLKPKALKESVEKAGFFIGSLVLLVPSDNLKTDINNTVILNGSAFILLNGVPLNSDEETKLKILDEGYVTKKEYKKLLKSLKTESYAINNEDDYHVKIISL